MLLIFVERNTPRFSYIAKLIFNNLLGVEFSVTHNREEFANSQDAKLCYAKNSLGTGLFIQSSQLLFESDISDQNPSKGQYKDDFVFYLTSTKSALPYDPLAASFFLVSRYEEYLPFIADEHNRFPAKESYAYKNKVLNKPLVNTFAEHIKEALQSMFLELDFFQREYKFTNTVDIDNAYAYKGKGFIRSIGGFGKDLIRFDFREMAMRFRSIFGFVKDPFETFDHQYGLQEKYAYDTIYFALFAPVGQFDRSLSMQSLRLQRMLKSINDFCEVGIHPSYRSNRDTKLAEEELRSLEDVLNTNISKSRQHFLKMKFPQTYRNLLEMDITDDYSMGYAEESGFRAGICTPFRFYDLEYEVETPLLVHPFPFMDGTYIYYKSIGPEEAWSEIQYYIDICKKYRGEFIPIWHNRVYSEKDPEWLGWNKIFERMVENAV